jgi:hypothetical protein
MKSRHTFNTPSTYSAPSEGNFGLEPLAGDAPAPVSLVQQTANSASIHYWGTVYEL